MDFDLLDRDVDEQEERTVHPEMPVMEIDFSERDAEEAQDNVDSVLERFFDGY